MFSVLCNCPNSLTSKYFFCSLTHEWHNTQLYIAKFDWRVGKLGFRRHNDYLEEVIIIYFTYFIRRPKPEYFSGKSEKVDGIS